MANAILSGLHCTIQAKRLVKSSIIAIETSEQMMDDEDFVQDNAEVTDFVNTHRGSEMPAASGDHRHHNMSLGAVTITKAHVVLHADKLQGYPIWHAYSYASNAMQALQTLVLLLLFCYRYRMHFWMLLHQTKPFTCPCRLPSLSAWLMQGISEALTVFSVC